MGKSHQTIAGQMKSELEEPLAAYAGGMKERRKIVQAGIEKLLKTKVQQTQTVNKVESALIHLSRIERSDNTLVERSIRARLPTDQGLSSTGPHGYGSRRAQE